MHGRDFVQLYIGNIHRGETSLPVVRLYKGRTHCEIQNLFTHCSCVFGSNPVQFTICETVTLNSIDKQAVRRSTYSSERTDDK